MFCGILACRILPCISQQSEPSFLVVRVSLESKIDLLNANHPFYYMEVSELSHSSFYMLVETIILTIAEN